MKYLLILGILITTDLYGASFFMRKDRDVRSLSLVDIRSVAHELQSMSPADDDLIYKFNGIYKVKASKGQGVKAILRQFVRYNSEWRLDEMELYRHREVTRSEIYDGLFSEGEEVSSWIYKRAQKFFNKLVSILKNNHDLELFYYTSTREDVFHTDGWLVYNTETRELLAVDISVDYEF